MFPVRSSPRLPEMPDLCLDHLPDMFQFFRRHSHICDKEDTPVDHSCYAEGRCHIFLPGLFFGTETEPGDRHFSFFQNEHRMGHKCVGKLSASFRNMSLSCQKIKRVHNKTGMGMSLKLLHSRHDAFDVQSFVRHPPCGPLRRPSFPERSKDVPNRSRSHSRNLWQLPLPPGSRC